nr:reverse transcriptase domain-containing protein [Tanacetum cinerariifolium]
MFKQLHINITLVDALILIPKYHKLLKALLFNKEKLLELANTPLNENCLAVILKKLPEKHGDLGKFLISCGFSKLKCKALVDLGASINLMPLSVWKKLGLPELISTRKTLELANRAICTPDGIARDVFVPVGKFIFPADFVIVDYESDPRVPLILGRPFLQTARALIDVHGEEMILHDDDIFDPKGDMVLIEKLINLDSTNDLPPPHNINPLSGSTTSSSPNHLLEDFADELALITFPPGNDDLPFDIEFDLKEIEYLLNYDPIKSSDFLPSLEYDSFLFEDFSEVDAFPSTNNEDKVFNLGILIQENLFEVNTRVAQDKNVKKLAISHASLILEDFDPPLSLYELPFHKEVPWPETLLSFSFENEEKVFKPMILTSKGVYSTLLLKLSHRGPKAFKVIKILKSPMKIFTCSFGEDICILDVPCLYFYPP